MISGCQFILQDLQAQCLCQVQGISFQVFDFGINSAQSSFPALLGSPGFHKLFGEKQRFLIISFITRHLAEILPPKLYNSYTIRAKRLIYFLHIVGTQTSVEYIYIYIYIYIHIYFSLYLMQEKPQLPQFHGWSIYPLPLWFGYPIIQTNPDGATEIVDEILEERRRFFIMTTVKA